MALKAGRVGVAPSQVDVAGNIIGGGSGSDSYTKAEADAKFATKTELSEKVPVSQLTANSKEFYFAYDATSEKYGYKAGATGEFHPFENAAAGLILPDRISTGLTFPGNLKFEEGGYQIIDDTCYFDIILKNSGGTVSSGSIIENAPDCLNGEGAKCIAVVDGTKSKVQDLSANPVTVNKDGTTSFTITGATVYSNWYVRVIAIYKVEV